MTDEMNDEMFEAYWEDRGAALADDLTVQRVVLGDHQRELAALAAKELARLDDTQRGPALESMLRGYRVRLHRAAQ
jgi:hypothetical protein